MSQENRQLVEKSYEIDNNEEPKPEVNITQGPCTSSGPTTKIRLKGIPTSGKSDAGIQQTTRITIFGAGRRPSPSGSMKQNLAQQSPRTCGAYAQDEHATDDAYSPRLFTADGSADGTVTYSQALEKEIVDPLDATNRRLRVERQITRSPQGMILNTSLGAHIVDQQQQQQSCSPEVRQPCSALPTSEPRLQPPGRRLQPPGSRLQPPGSRLQAPGSRLQPPGSRLQPPELRQSPVSGLQTPGSRLQAPGSRLQPPGSRLQPPGSRLQPPGSRLQAPSTRLQDAYFSLPTSETILQETRSRLEAPGYRLQTPEPRQPPPRSRLQQPQTPGSRLQAPGSRLQAPGSRLQPPELRPYFIQETYTGLPTSETMVQTPRSRLPPPGSRLPPPGSRLPPPGSRQVPGSRLQAPGSKLQAPKSRLQPPGGSGARVQLPCSTLLSESRLMEASFRTQEDSFRTQEPSPRSQEPCLRLQTPSPRYQESSPKRQAPSPRTQEPCARSQPQSPDRRDETQYSKIQSPQTPITRSTLELAQEKITKSPGASATITTTTTTTTTPIDDILNTSHIPSSPAAATIDEIKKLIEEEKRDVLQSQTLSPELATKLKQLKKKTLLEETLQETLPTLNVDVIEREDPSPSGGSDVLASLMDSEERGVISTSSSPKKMYDALFGASGVLGVTLDGERSVAVSPAAPSPLNDIVVPVGEATQDEIAVLIPEIEYQVAQTDQEIPKADAYSESVQQGHSPQVCTMRRECIKREGGSPVDVQYIPRGELEEQKAPWDIDLGSLEDLVGGQLSMLSAGERLPSDESIRATLQRFEYILDVEKPKHYSCVQLRGTQRPPWFPGYFFVHPENLNVSPNIDLDNYVRLEHDPSKVFAQIWTIFKPNNLENSENVLL